MAPSTPRKPRHRNQPSSGAANLVPASDYESDAPYTGPSVQQPVAVQPAQVGRTIGEMNLSVLKCYLPTINSYVAMAHNATIYELDPDAMGWGEPTIKGPLFVCNQEPDLSTGQPVPRACVFVMNRQSLDNLIVDLANVFECELENQFIMLRTTSAAGNEVVWGLYMDAAAIDSSWTAIQDRWHAVRGVNQ